MPRIISRSRNERPAVSNELPDVSSHRFGFGNLKLEGEYVTARETEVLKAAANREFCWLKAAEAIFWRPARSSSELREAAMVL